LLPRANEGDELMDETIKSAPADAHRAGKVPHGQPSK
jgi:hypothetical protein